MQARRPARPISREGQAGPVWGDGGGFVVAMKPDNAGGAEGTSSSRKRPEAARDRGIGDGSLHQLLNSVQEAAGGVACQSEGRTRNPLLHAVRQGVCRPDVLWQAHRRCRINGGVPGVDGQTFGDIEQYGLTKWLEELAEELRKKTYQPQPVRRVYIPKPDGKTTSLSGIPTIRDRVVQNGSPA